MPLVATGSVVTAPPPGIVDSSWDTDGAAGAGRVRAAEQGAGEGGGGLLQGERLVGGDIAAELAAMWWA